VLSDPLVGRRVESDALKRAIDAAAKGRGSLVLLTGEPGIGKTRLSAHAAEHAEASGLQVRRASCWEGPGAPFWPWMQILRTILGPTAPPDVRRLAGELAADATSGMDGDAEPVRLAVFDAVSSYLVEQASVAPMLLVFDDLHWSDLPSLRLLAFFAREVRGAGIAVIGTCRDIEVERGSETGHALEAVCASGDVIKLEGLATTEVAELIQSATGNLAATDFARSVHERTGGNPLFVRELARLFSAPGRSPSDLSSLPIPEGIHGVIRRRLARLSQATYDILAVAAVFGQEFRLDLTAHAASISNDQALGLMDAAVDARLVSVVGGSLGRYAFSHALVRDVLYESTPASRRAAAHARAGESIEALAAADDHLAELASHYLRAPMDVAVDKGISYTVRAGRRAIEHLAYEDAVAHFERALSAVEAVPADDRRAEIMLDLGDARLRAGDVPGARAVFEEAADLARRRGRPDDLARAALGFGAGLAGFEVQLFDQRQIDLLEEALAARPPDDSSLRAWLLARLSVAISIQESIDRRCAVAEEAIAMARRVGDDGALAYALAAHCDAVAGPDDCELRLEESAEIVRIARAAGDRPLELLGRRLRVVALLEVGDVMGTDIETDLYTQAAEILRQPLYLWYVDLWRGMRAQLDGRFDDALAAADDAARVGARAHSVNAKMLAYVLRWTVFAQQGRWIEAHENAQAASELMTGWGNPYFANADAWLFGIGGAFEQARAALRRLPDPSGAWITKDAEWLATMCQLSFALSLLDDRDAARDAYERLLPYRGRFGIEGIGAGSHGPVEHHLGLLARTSGRIDDAIAHFEAALEADRRIGAPFLEATVLRELASTLRLRNADGDAARADALTSDGATIERRLSGGQIVDETVPVVAPAGRSADSVFRSEGEFWTLAFDGSTVRVKDTKGMHDIGELLARPGAEVPALDLATERAVVPARTDVSGLHEPGHAGELLDEQARAQYKARLIELEQEIDEAVSLGDDAGAERARVERDALTRELTSAYGLGGRPRRSGDPAERARTTVTRRIKEAIGRIEELHPPLGRHLRNSVRTGTFCSYRPEQPTAWEL
jgi:tetratricopeptide (TPR) repeat protein